MRMPVATAFSETPTRWATFRMRAIGSPTKIVKPAIAPRMRVWAVLMRSL